MRIRPAIGQDLDRVLDGEADAAARVRALEFRGDPGGLGAEIDGAELYLGP